MQSAVQTMLSQAVRHRRREPDVQHQVAWNWFGMPSPPPATEYKKIVPTHEAQVQTDAQSPMQAVKKTHAVTELTTAATKEVAIQHVPVMISVATSTSPSPQDQDHKQTSIETSKETMWRATSMRAERAFRDDLQLKSDVSLTTIQRLKLHEKTVAMFRAQKKKMRAKEKAKQKKHANNEDENGSETMRDCV